MATATLSSVLQHRCGLRNVAPRGLRPLDPARCRFAGRAVTLRYLPLREDVAERFSAYTPGAPFHAAYEQANAGDVVVIGTGESAQAGILGEMLATRLAHRGAAGVVCDGGMRDVGEIVSLGLPVWFAGAAPASSSASLMLVDFGLPVVCGGVTVFPGDMIVADGDGAVVCPAAEWNTACAEAAERDAIEASIRRRVTAGEPLAGLYLPGEQTRAAFARWVAAGSPSDRMLP